MFNLKSGKMAKGKKSFKLYTDQDVFFHELPDELAGRLIKHLFLYVNDEDPSEEDIMIKLAFAPIKRQLKHDLKKYESVVERNKKNGSLGGRPKKNPINPVGYSGLNKNPNKPDKDKDKDKEGIINRDDKILIPYNEFIKEIKEGYHSQAVELWYMQLSLKPKTLTELLTVGFKGQLLTDEKEHKNTSEVKTHFKNWLNTQDRLNLLSKYKK